MQGDEDMFEVPVLPRETQCVVLGGGDRRQHHPGDYRPGAITGVKTARAAVLHETTG